MYYVLFRIFYEHLNLKHVRMLFSSELIESR